MQSEEEYFSIQKIDHTCILNVEELDKKINWDGLALRYNTGRKYEN